MDKEPLGNPTKHKITYTKMDRSNSRRGATSKETPEFTRSLGASFAGQEIHEYAQSASLPLDAVWRLIKGGELMVRNVHGKLMVCSDPEQEALVVRPSSVDDVRPGMIPLPSLDGIAPTSAEVAALIDHLSLAREENREMLRLSQESLERISSLSDQLLASKNDQIKKKDDEIQNLKQDLTMQLRETAGLRREMEDLRMLISTLANKR